MDVRMPDGTIITNVPEGTTKAQLMAKIQGQSFAPQPTQRAPEPTPEPEDDRSLYQKAQGWIKDTVSPPREDIPELPYIYQGADESALEMYQQKDPSAQMSQDEYGNPVFAGDSGRFYPDQPGLTLRDIPEFQTDATEFLQKAAPSIAGGAVVAPMRVIPAAATMFGVGSLSGGTREGAESVSEGRDYDYSVPLVEGAIDATGEVGGRILFKLLQPLAKKFFGAKSADIPMVKQDGTLTDEGAELLERARQDPEAGDALGVELAKLKEGKVLSPEEAKRAELFIKRDLSPTKAQVSRTADDFTAQQDALTETGPVRTAIEEQDIAIKGQLEGLRPDVAGGAPRAHDDITSLVKAADDDVREAYRLAREGSPETQFQLNSLNAKLDALTASGNREAMDIAAHMRADLTRKGLTNPDNMVFTGGKQVNTANRANVNTAEAIRQQANGPIYESASPYQRQILRETKDAIDDDVQAAIGRDVFDAPRSRKAELEQSIDRTRQGGRDKRTNKGLVRDIVDNKIGREDIARKIKGVGTRAEDLSDLKQFFTSNGMEDSWQAIRRDVIDDIIEVSFKGAEGEKGVAEITKKKLNDATKNYTDDKMAVLFNEQERGLFKDLKEIMRYREPVTGRHQGSGPSAVAIRKVENVVSKLPFVGEFGEWMIKSVVDPITAKKILDSGVTKTGQQLTNAQVRAASEAILSSLKTNPLGGTAAGLYIGAEG